MLELEDFEKLTQLNCAYCGEAPAHSLDGYNGIDRVDSSLGYTPNNSWPCCEICNRMKSDTSQEFFIEHILKIARLHG